MSGTCDGDLQPEGEAWGRRGFLHQLITPHGTEVALNGHDLILLQEMSHYGIDTSSCCRHDLMLQENILESLMLQEGNSQK